MTEQRLTRQQQRKQDRARMAEWQRMNDRKLPEKSVELLLHQLQSADYSSGFTDGYNAGANEASQKAVFLCYAAASMAAHNYLGFGNKRITNFIKAMDNEVRNSIDDRDIVGRLERETGYNLLFLGPNGGLTGVDDL